MFIIAPTLTFELAPSSSLRRRALSHPFQVMLCFNRSNFRTTHTQSYESLSCIASSTTRSRCLLGSSCSGLQDQVLLLMHACDARSIRVTNANALCSRILYQTWDNGITNGPSQPPAFVQRHGSLMAEQVTICTVTVNPEQVLVVQNNPAEYSRTRLCPRLALAF